MRAARTTPGRYQAALDALRRFPRLLTSPEARDLATEMAFQRGSLRPRLPTARAVDALLARVSRETFSESPTVHP